MQNGLFLCLDEFLSWLALHELDYVGSPGTWFFCPIAVFLSERDGRVYGVDHASYTYGPAGFDYCQWQSLPLWARRLACWSERYAHVQLTGRDVFNLLATIEQYYGRQHDSILCAN